MFDDFFEQLKTNPLEATFNAILQYQTGGLLGYEDGSFSKGFSLRGVDEAFGEITGRNIARKQAQISNKALDQARKDEENRRKFEIQRQQAQETQASQMAASRNRSLNLGSSGVRVGDASQIESQMATDFLGL